MVAGVVRRLGELLDRDVGRRQVGVAEPEVDDVLAGSPCLDLQPVDDGEDVRRQPVIRRNSMDRGYRRPPRAPVDDAGEIGSVPDAIDVVVEIPRGQPQQVRVRPRAAHLASTGGCSRPPSIRPTTASSPTPSARTATRSTPWCSSTTRRSPAAGSTARPVGVFWMTDDAGPRRQDHLRPRRRPPVGPRDRHRRPARASSPTRSALLRGVQGARARQVLEHPRLGGPGRGVAEIEACRPGATDGDDRHTDPVQPRPHRHRTGPWRPSAGQGRWP